MSLTVMTTKTAHPKLTYASQPEATLIGIFAVVTLATYILYLVFPFVVASERVKHESKL
jgi:uncharacterized membrane protein